MIFLSSYFSCFLFTPWIEENHPPSFATAYFLWPPPFLFFCLMSFLFLFVDCYLQNIFLTSAHSLSVSNSTCPNPDLSLALFSFAYTAARCRAKRAKLEPSSCTSEKSWAFGKRGCSDSQFRYLRIKGLHCPRFTFPSLHCISVSTVPSDLACLK